jgi:cellulose synthase/poly-beta-1,6-N-acetylglucosamine synthase-like glycosyltransferase
MMPWWAMALLVFGVNFALWGTLGMCRLTGSGITAARRRRESRRQAKLEAAILAGAAVPQAARPKRRRRRAGRRPNRQGGLTTNDVAVLIPAHNEGTVLGESLRAIMEHIPPWNVHVVSDASTDDTVAVARAAGAKVFQTEENYGKAGALQEAIYRFRLIDRFPVVMLLDADTRVDPGYFASALPQFDNSDVVAVAGAVRTATDRALSFGGQVLVGHRRRIYSIGQRVLKFGQTWRRANATHIVPGFASLYRTDVLPEIDMNPPGLVIEDFNMTFEVYQKGLGKVGFSLGAVAVTQDPDNFHDYVRQTRRWALGLWQTVRRHRPRANLFTLTVGLLLIELITSSVIFLILPALLLILAMPDMVAGAATWPVFGTVYATLASHMKLSTILFGVLLPDLAMTLIVAILERQPRMLLFAAFFPVMRVIDAALGLWAIPLTFLSRSTGRWKSPARQESVIPAAPVEPLPPSLASTQPVPVIPADEPFPAPAWPAESNRYAEGPLYVGDGPHASG